MKKRHTKASLEDKFIAQNIITSTKMAETFISKWLEVHNGTRKQALKRLHQLGITLSQLRKKRVMHSDAICETV